MRTLVFLFGLAGLASGAESAEKLYQQRIVAPADLSATAQAAVVDLERYLGEIAGVKFARQAERSAAGIILARAAEPDVPAAAAAALAGRSPQSFCLWPEGGRLWLVSGSDEGLSHAVCYNLERLGVRWYAPTERWTIVPRRDDVRISQPIVQSPAFACRSFFGTGGFGGSLPCDPQRSLQAEWMTWQRRNRFGGEFAFGGHAGEAFNTKYKALLESHPEYLAEIDGQRVPWSPIAKWCPSNPDVLKLFVEDRLQALRQQRKADPHGPRSSSAAGLRAVVVADALRPDYEGPGDVHAARGRGKGAARHGL